MEGMHTLQETFDLSGLALVAQGRPAVNDRGECVYLADDGCRCAAGHLMTANKRTLRNLRGSIAFAERPARLLRDRHDLGLCEVLQRAHDLLHNTMVDMPDALTWRTLWLERIVNVARDYGVSPNTVLQAARDAGWSNVPDNV